MVDPTKVYGLKFDSHPDVFLVYPLGAVRPVGPGEWKELTEAGVPLVLGGTEEAHFTAVTQQAWASRGYVLRPGE
jgi:hypothetical protein